MSASATAAPLFGADAERLRGVVQTMEHRAGPGQVGGWVERGRHLGDDEAAALAAQGSSLVSTYEWAFLFGPGLVVGFGNGLMLGYLMYRSGLVPRRMAMLGLVGGPMLILSFGLILFGAYDNGAGPAALMALPEIAWEASLGIYAAWKGFRPSPIAELRGGHTAEPAGAPFAFSS